MSYSTGGMWLIHGPEQRMKTDLRRLEWRKSMPYINHLLQSKYWQYYDVIMTWHTTSTMNLTTNRENGIFDWCHLFHKEEPFVIGTYRPSFLWRNRFSLFQERYFILVIWVHLPTYLRINIFLFSFSTKQMVFKIVIVFFVTVTVMYKYFIIYLYIF